MADVSKLKVRLARPHPGQSSVASEAGRFNVLVCGRRWGKTTWGLDRLARPALAGKPVAWFAPTIRNFEESWRGANAILADVISRKDESDHRLDLVTGGSVEFWNLSNPGPIRGRKYALAVIDEAAAVSDLESAWNKVIRPTLVDYRGQAWFLSTPAGRGFFWKLWLRGQSDEHSEWRSWQRPSGTNPHLDPVEIEAARQELPDLSFRQEFMAEFVDDAGGVFRGSEVCVDRGRTDAEPPRPGVTYVVGVDLARLRDFTVITVLDEFARQVYHERLNHVSWERQIELVIQVARRYNEARVYVDSTGVGDPITERLRRAGLPVRAYHMTLQSKQLIIDGLALRIEGGNLRLMDVAAQTRELQAYQYEITPSRNYRTNAPEGEHDDCVIALALACHGLPRSARRVEEGPEIEIEEASEPASRDVDDDRWWT